MKRTILTTLFLAAICFGGMGQTTLKSGLFKMSYPTSINIVIDSTYRIVDTSYSVGSDSHRCFKSIKATYKNDGKPYQVITKYQIDKRGYWLFYSIIVEPLEKPVSAGLLGTGTYIIPNNYIPIMSH